MENQKKQSPVVKGLLIGISVIFLFIMLVLPLYVVITESLRKGLSFYLEAITD